MGGAVSVSNNNDDMVTKLINAQYIKTPCVERAFRAVDRGNYVLHKDSAYSDSAWRTDHLHLSAPCIYAQVLEGLLLEPGQRFLNIGSGTGYLSTMVAMILGSEGTNHGVELRAEVIRYAHMSLKSFKKCASYNPDFFADPVFIEGNAYHLVPPETKYDRIYCGAAVEPAFLDRLRDDFLNVGGVIVAPVQDELLQVYKENLRRDIVISLLDVSFSHLIRRTTPNARHIEQQPPNSVVLPLQHVQSLQEQCRARIVRLVRSKLLEERPTRGGIFAPAFASKNCPPLPLPSFSAKPQPASTSGQQQFHDAIDRFISHEILGVPLEHLQDRLEPEVSHSRDSFLPPGEPSSPPSEGPPFSSSANSSSQSAGGNTVPQAEDSNQDRLPRSLSTSAITGEDSEPSTNPVSQTSVSGGSSSSSNRARSSSESAGQSSLIAEALGFRSDGKVVRICGKTLIASHSPCAVKRCGPPVNKHPPFRFRRPQFSLDGAFANVDESDEDDAPTVVSSSRGRLNFDSAGAHSSAGSSSSEDHDSLEESLARHRNVKAFNAAKKASETGVESESSMLNSKAGGPSSGGSVTGSQVVGGEPSGLSFTNEREVDPSSDGGATSTDMNGSFSSTVKEIPSACEASGTSSNSNAKKVGDGSQQSSSVNNASDNTTAAVRGCSDESRPGNAGGSGVSSNRSLIDCLIDNWMDSDSVLEDGPRRSSSDEDGGSDAGQSSDSNRSTGDSCARTKAVKRQSVDDPRGRANRCKRSNRRSSGRSDDADADHPASASVTASVGDNSALRMSWTTAQAAPNPPRSSLITPSFSLSLDRLEAAEERVNNRSRVRRLSVLSLLSRLASSYVDENQRQSQRRRQGRGQPRGNDGSAQSAMENEGHQNIEVDEEEEEDVGDEEEVEDEENGDYEEEDSALSEDPSGDDVDGEIYMECGGTGSRVIFEPQEKNYVTSSDEEPEYFKTHLRRNEAPVTHSSKPRLPDAQKQETRPKSQNQKRKKKRKSQKPELWVRGTDGFDLYLDYKNSQKPFCKLPREFRLEIRMLDRLQRLPLPPPIRDRLLLGNWTSRQTFQKSTFAHDEDEEMESLC